MKKICPFCEKEIANFLEHLLIEHSISSPEDYKLKLREKENKKEKIKGLFAYMEELKIKHRAGKISDEELRNLRETWERDNNLIW